MKDASERGMQKYENQHRNAFYGNPDDEKERISTIGISNHEKKFKVRDEGKIFHSIEVLNTFYPKNNIWRRYFTGIL